MAQTGGRWSGARSTAAGLTMPTTEPLIVLLNVDLLWRANPVEVGDDLATALAKATP